MNYKLVCLLKHSTPQNPYSNGTSWYGHSRTKKLYTSKNNKQKTPNPGKPNFYTIIQDNEMFAIPTRLEMD